MRASLFRNLSRCSRFVTELTRNEGRLTGELKDPTGKKPVTPITKIEEEVGKKTKVDDNHLTGSLMNMFDSKALRVKP